MRRLSTSPAFWKTLYKYYIKEHLRFHCNINWFLSAPCREGVCEEYERVRSCMRTYLCMCMFDFLFFLIKNLSSREAFVVEDIIRRSHSGEGCMLCMIGKQWQCLKRRIHKQLVGQEEDTAPYWKGTGMKESRRITSQYRAKRAFITSCLILHRVGIRVGSPTWLKGP